MHQFIFVLIVGFLATAYGQSTPITADSHRKDIESHVLKQILDSETYCRNVRPLDVNGTDGPVETRVNMYVRDVEEIDDLKMEFTSQIILRMEWRDERLQYDNYNGKVKYLTLTDSSRIWIPDLFFGNERKSHLHDNLVPNIYMRIFPNGNVLYSARVTITASCPMNKTEANSDRRVCPLKMASYARTSDDLVFLWKEENPVQHKNVQLPRYLLEKTETDTCTSRTNTGEYSCLKISMIFKKDLHWTRPVAYTIYKQN